MSHCEDCGCKVYNGCCTNCHEEIYIYVQDQQNDEYVNFSPEFMGKVNEQMAIRGRKIQKKGGGDMRPVGEGRKPTADGGPALSDKSI